MAGGVEVSGLQSVPTEDITFTMDQVLIERGYSPEEIEARAARLMKKQWKSSFFETVEDDELTS